MFLFKIIESYNDLKQKNEELVSENIWLKNKVMEQSRQLEEITDDLKDFNISLEEEIAERTKTEENLREREEQFICAIEKSPIPMMVFEENGEVLLINESWGDITGYTLQDIPTISKWSERVYGNSCELSEGEKSIRIKNGEMRIWDFYSTPLGNMQGKQEFILLVAIDITERKKMEDLQNAVEEERRNLNELKELDRIKTEFFANISHELRTPINVIFSSLQIHDLKYKNCSFLNEPPDCYKYSKIMKQNCYRLLRLVNNLIDLTKIDSGYFEINANNYNIIHLVRQITLSVRDYVEHKGLSLMIETDTDEKIIACDPEKIERITLNLLSNAVKFTPEGGKIMVRIEDCTDNICIRVKDTGRGIPKDKLDFIFERFVQADKSLTRDHEGSGIGLSLVKAFVELHEGTISVKSQVDYGTEIIIYIPCRTIESSSSEIPGYNSIDEGYIERINIEFSDIYH